MLKKNLTSVVSLKSCTGQEAVVINWGVCVWGDVHGQAVRERGFCSDA